MSREKNQMSDKVILPIQISRRGWDLPCYTSIQLRLMVDALFEIFMASIQYQHIPNCWREVRVVFLPKPGQNNYQLAKAFRPIISLTSFQLKTLEKLIDRYLRNGALKLFKIHTRQFAYLRTNQEFQQKRHCIT